MKKHLPTILATVVAAGVAAAVFLIPPKQAQVPEKASILLTTSHGPMELTLWPHLAPRHVAQFVRLVKAGVFDNSALIRIEKNFVIQWGGTYDRPQPLTAEQQAVVINIPAEFSQHKHVRGTVSMARADDPNSATTSFSILLAPAPHLDGNYTVFGEMTPASDETLKKIESVPVVVGTTKPGQPVMITKAEVKL